MLFYIRVLEFLFWSCSNIPHMNFLSNWPYRYTLPCMSVVLAQTEKLSAWFSTFFVFYLSVCQTQVCLLYLLTCERIFSQRGVESWQKHRMYHFCLEWPSKVYTVSHGDAWLGISQQHTQLLPVNPHCIHYEQTYGKACMESKVFEKIAQLCDWFSWLRLFYGSV